MAEKKYDTGEKLISEHRRARFDYTIDDTLEAGLVLLGSEVKALRQGEGSLNDAYALPENGEFFLYNMHVGIYKPAASFGHMPTRKRKLLLNKSEMEKWSAKVRERGYSIVPLLLYFKNGKVKVRLGLGRGKSNIDRRNTIRERMSKREMDRATRRR